MSKKNTALIIGGLAALGALFYFTKGGAQEASGGGGGGLLDTIFGRDGDTAPAPGNSEYGGVESPANEGVINTWQPYEGVISPTGPEWNGGLTGHPALDVNEQGLFVNRETGKVYPVDPISGRQRARVDALGNVVGRYIADPLGVPYGAVEATVLEQRKTEQGIPYAITNVKTLTQGAGSGGSSVIQGVNPSSGQPYTFWGLPGFNVAAWASGR